MATIKLCTDFSQSKKLAEFLSLESADMYYMETSCNNYTLGVIQRMERDMLLKQAEYYKMFPCWSLAALLAFLPKSAQLEKGNATELYRVTLPVELEASDWYIDPIDACYEMIIKLHELTLL